MIAYKKINEVIEIRKINDQKKLIFRFEDVFKESDFDFSHDSKFFAFAKLYNK
jgi:hypothetical protein